MCIRDRVDAVRVNVESSGNLLSGVSKAFGFKVNSQGQRCLLYTSRFSVFFRIRFIELIDRFKRFLNLLFGILVEFLVEHAVERCHTCLLYTSRCV